MAGRRKPLVNAPPTRQKGTPNLRRTETGGYINKHGVTFTEEQKKALTNAVNAVNAKRKKLLLSTEDVPLTFAGEKIGGTTKDLRLMGREDNFLMSKQSKSLHRFRSEDQFNRYMQKLQSMREPDYLTDRARAYKRNYLKGFDDVFGSAGKDVRMKIQMMKPFDFVKLSESDTALDLAYYYTEGDRQGALNNIRRALGMNEKEEGYDDFDEDYD